MGCMGRNGSGFDVNVCGAIGKSFSSRFTSTKKGGVVAETTLPRSRDAYLWHAR